MNDIQREKFEAELKNLELSNAKLELELEKAKQAPGKNNSIIEFMKVTGVLVAAVGGLLGFITGVVFNQIRNEKLVLESKQLENRTAELNKERADLNAQMEIERAQGNRLREANVTMQNKLTSVRRKVAEERDRLAGIREATEKKISEVGSSPIAREVLDDLRTADEKFGKIEVQITSANAEGRAAAVDSRMESLISGLYSDSKERRLESYNGLVKDFSRDASVIDALIQYAESRSNNENGIYNTVVTLTDLSRTITRPRKSDIVAFCDKVAPLGPKIQRQVKVLKSWINQPSR